MSVESKHELSTPDTVPKLRAAMPPKRKMRHDDRIGIVPSDLPGKHKYKADKGIQGGSWSPKFERGGRWRAFTPRI